MIPTQQNCPHSPDGWCLKCVGELQSQIDEVHAILDADPSQIIRNWKDAYPEGLESKELTLAERVRALCRYAKDWKRWYLNETKM